ncbi:MAG: NUDIX domain-containing protein [Saccharofermentans sp.]|nr:NUDIX domain-containing protein [Saccharofermentans sp.]
MSQDMTVNVDDGIINIRVGAIILKNGKLLMAGNSRESYHYTVGGRIKFGETAKEAVEREVFEETGVHMKADRLGFIHENYFRGDAPSNMGKLIYEIDYYFYMTVPEDFDPVSMTFMEGDNEEKLTWVDLEGEAPYYPEFFRTELKVPSDEVRFFTTDER